MTTLQRRVQVVLDSLYKLEDELDRRDFLATDAECATLARLVNRWNEDTLRKIAREAKRAGVPS